MHQSIALLLALALVSAPALATLPPMSVHITPELSARIRLEPVEVVSHTDTIRLPGRVALDEHRVARIGPVLSGRVAEVRAFIGWQVKKGDVLAVLNSTELSNAQAAYLKAKTQVGLQRLAVDRAQRLFGEGIISKATLKEREGALAEAEVELRALADQLGVMGMSDTAIERLAQNGQINSVTPVTSTIEGTVIERHISVGQIAEISDELFTVADLSRVWVVAEAPEQDAHIVQMDSRVEVKVSALPRESFIGKIVFIADTVKPETRTVTMRMEVDNTHRKLKPEMLADMLIKRPAERVLMLPSAAVVRVNDQDHVFVAVASDRVELRPVSLGEDKEGQRRVFAGLAGGERIVVEGAFHLNNVRLLKELE
ncbi:efflux RND transporter periplasmic adaptor subunit [Methyloparacoccus murrellii]